MKMKLVVLMLLFAVVCMSSLAMASAVMGPGGVVFEDDEGDGGGPAEFAPVFRVICGEEEGDEGPAE